MERDSGGRNNSDPLPKWKYNKETHSIAYVVSKHQRTEGSIEDISVRNKRKKQNPLLSQQTSPKAQELLHFAMKQIARTHESLSDKKKLLSTDLDTLTLKYCSEQGFCRRNLEWNSRTFTERKILTEVRVGLVKWLQELPNGSITYSPVYTNHDHLSCSTFSPPKNTDESEREEDKRCTTILTESTESRTKESPQYQWSEVVRKLQNIDVQNLNWSSIPFPILGGSSIRLICDQWTATDVDFVISSVISSDRRCCCTWINQVLLPLYLVMIQKETTILNWSCREWHYIWWCCEQLKLIANQLKKDDFRTAFYIPFISSLSATANHFSLICIQQVSTGVEVTVSDDSEQLQHVQAVLWFLNIVVQGNFHTSWITKSFSSRSEHSFHLTEQQIRGLWTTSSCQRIAL